MLYALVILIMAMPGQNVATLDTSLQFKNKPDCETAAAALTKNLTDAGTKNFVWCVPLKAPKP